MDTIDDPTAALLQALKVNTACPDRTAVPAGSGDAADTAFIESVAEWIRLEQAL